MPTRSASYSLERVKLIWRWMPAAWLAATAPMVKSDPASTAAPMRMAASMAAVVTMLVRWLS